MSEEHLTPEPVAGSADPAGAGDATAVTDAADPRTGRTGSHTGSHTGGHTGGHGADHTGVLEALDDEGQASFTTVFSHALRGEPCHVVGLGPEPRHLPMGDWTRAADVEDLSLIAQCVGSTLDIGCGPGRLSAALAEAGHVVLGIDVVHEAVGQTRQRGVAALRRDVFDRLPGEGRWRSALLADGNVGIGGDPEALLKRVRQLLDPAGRVVVEVAGPGTPFSTHWAALECAGTRSRPFRWSVIGVDDIADIASAVGFAVAGTHRHGDERWSVVLEEPR